jgi:thiol-disulfide isomerase/thioredoxin
MAKLINLNQILNMSKKLLIYLILFVPLLLLNAQKNIPNIPIETFKGTYTTMSKELNEDSFYIISFWATWCVPCINELDAINEVYDDLSKEMDFKVLAISTDDARTKRRVKPLVNGKAWKFDVLLDENHDLKRALNISGLPHTIIARKNQILHRRVGYAPGEELGLLDKLKEYEIK